MSNLKKVLALRQEARKEASEAIENVGTFEQVMTEYGADELALRIDKNGTPYVAVYKDKKSVDNIWFSKPLAAMHKVLPVTVTELLDYPMYNLSLVNEENKPFNVLLIGREQGTVTREDLVSLADVLKARAVNEVKMQAGAATS